MKLLLSVIGLALATLRENKVRSFLTLLGVIIGTGTIIGVGSILAGLDGAVSGADPERRDEYDHRAKGCVRVCPHAGGPPAQAPDL